MKKVFQQLRMLRNLAMLLMLMLCANVSAFALESDDINAKILDPKSTVIPQWTDDAANPWRFSNDSTTLFTPDFEDIVSTKLSMTFSSQYPVNFGIRTRFEDNGGNFFIYIDGEENNIGGSSSYSWFAKIIPAGNHTIEFVADLLNNTSWVGLSIVQLFEYKPLETSCLKDGSMPLTFENDQEFPWLTYDGSILSMNPGDSSSKISTTFTIDKPSLFSFEYYNKNDEGHDYRDVTTVVIDSVEYLSSRYNEYTWRYDAVVLQPGTHTVEFGNTNNNNGSSRTKIRNVFLSQNWIEVNSQPGELNNKLIQALGDKNLEDADIVKVNGSMNLNDWNTISQLMGLVGIDLTGTNITSVPESAFRAKPHLSTVMLPNTVTEIGKDAFGDTNLYEMTVPNSVEKIGAEAWRDTPLRYIKFEENSKLTHLGYGALARTRILELDMPNSVTHFSRLYDEDTYRNSVSINDVEGWDIVEGCQSLKKLHLSDGLTGVPANMANECSVLQEVHLPLNADIIGYSAFAGSKCLKSIELPESLTSIGDRAFYWSGLESLTLPKNVSYLGEFVFENCSNLKNVVLNSQCWDMLGTFCFCRALETVVLPCATPPSVILNPFNDVDMSKVKLIVPDFALNAYRSDFYWYRFTNIVAGDEASIRDYWAIRGNLTLDKKRKMQGSPSIDMKQGGTLTMDTDINQGFNEFNFETSESNPGAFLSKSNSVTANKLTTNFYVEEASKWFFFSPVCDVKMSDISYPSTDSWVIRYYDGARRASQNSSTGNWVNVPADGTLYRGQGYIIQANASGWLHMPVAAENHSQFFGANEVTMTLDDNPCETEANAGWNFIANPYPCYYDIYHINMQAPITVWNGSTYRAFSLNDGDRGDDTFVLRPMQPFFVQKTAADITVGLPLVGRQINTVIDRTRAPRREGQGINPLRNLLNLELTKMDGTEADDYTRIVINEEASLEYERTGDASKFMSMDDQVAQFFSLGENNTPLAINERPYDNGIVNLGVYMPKSGETYTISATRSDRQAWLYDAETGIEQDLTLGDYMFTSSKSGFDCNRFSIRFSPVTNAVDKVSEVLTKVNAGKGVLAITAADEAKVAVYAADGSVIASTTGSTEIEVPAGIYLVKVGGKTFKTIVK